MDNNDDNDNDNSNKKGIWIGIDLGTSNCTAAFWDTKRNRAKLIRFRSHLASSPTSSGKCGRILPSCAFYGCCNTNDSGFDNAATAAAAAPENKSEENTNNLPVSLLGIGREAIQLDERQYENNNHTSDNTTTSKTSRGGNKENNNHQDGLNKRMTSLDGKLVSSVKRIWGMTKQQIESELELDNTFLDSCPFESTLMEFPPKNKMKGQEGETLDGMEEQQQQQQEGSRLCIRLDKKNTNRKQNQEEKERDVILIPPLQVATDLLKTIREEAQLYIQRERNVEPLRSGDGCDSDNNDESNNDESNTVRHCVIGVPAHFSRNRCQSIVQAARKAGFDGHVSTIVESTAAAVAYGLAVSSRKETPSLSSSSAATATATAKKNILVFDMGGGTTDVTIAEMSASNNSNNDEPSFQVLATAGDRHLGGDDMDMLLAQLLTSKLQSNSQDKKIQQGDEITFDWKKLRQTSRAAKEELCGDGSPENPQKESTIVTHHNHSCNLTYDNFDMLIKPLMDRAQALVETTISSISSSYGNSSSRSSNNDTITTADIHEVILVGGATRTPSVVSMLQNLFPNVEFCTSIHGEKAVAQGAAIQSALRSGLIPKHVIRNALMLDILPHPIGVLLTQGGQRGGTTMTGEEMYVPILESGMSLPAMNCAAFELADIEQKGVSIVAVEDVGDEFPLERLGEFTFLLHRLSEKENKAVRADGKRTVEVGMTVETSGKFIVNIFDRNDPEHLQKKERYQKWKQQQQQMEDDHKRETTYVLDGRNENKSFPEDISTGFSLEEVLLMLGCILLFGLYILVRVSFRDVGGIDTDGTEF